MGQACCKSRKGSSLEESDKNIPDIQKMKKKKDKNSDSDETNEVERGSPTQAWGEQTHIWSNSEHEVFKEYLDTHYEHKDQEEMVENTFKYGEIFKVNFLL